MSKEAYCSFEVSKLLKEKGFDGGCTYLMEDFKPYNMVRATWPQTYKEDGNYFNHKGLLLCPTHQMAMAWLREEKGIFIDIITYTTAKNIQFRWVGYEKGRLFSQEEGKTIYFNSYEEAVEAALKYTLENLITN